MISKPKMYDEVEVTDFDFVPIELGGHKLVIKEAIEYTSGAGKVSLKVSIDTAPDDKQPEYFAEQYRKNDRPDKKWNNSAVKYVSLGEEENQVRMLKGFITAYENSNNCQFDWSKDWSQLTGKKIGGVFGMEEYESEDGTIKTNNKLRDFRSIDKIDNVKIPKVKLNNGSYIEYEEYINRRTTSENNNSIELDPMDLPF